MRYPEKVEKLVRPQPVALEVLQDLQQQIHTDGVDRRS